MDAPLRVGVLGVQVDALSSEDLNGIVETAVRAGRKVVIAHHNLHSIALWHREPGLRGFCERADFAHIDGMPIIWWGRLLGHPLQARHRVTYVDWFPLLLGLAARSDWRVFYLGSARGVAERGAELMRARFPGLQIYTRHGFFHAVPGSAENTAVLEEIRLVRPHILMVGMGMPRQERWIVQHLDCLEANVILPAGACMDYFAGTAPVPPRWLGRVGLEWAYRLVREPQRLGWRYLVEPWSLLPAAWRDLRRRCGR